MFIRPLFIALLSLASSFVLAWGPKGHEVIGAVADKMLAGTHAGDKVQQILGMELAGAALWADCAKSVNNSNGQFIYFANPRFRDCKLFESDDGKARMVDFVKRNWDTCHPEPGEEACHKQYHYTDVAIQHDKYARGLAGTSDHDVVAAINAAVLVLKGKPAPAPFSIVDQREALLMLTHYVGDIHQPLHVGAVYLNADGDAIDPDKAGFDPATKTNGGNEIDAHGPNLHAVWDETPPNMDPLALDDKLLELARTTPATSGDVLQWSTLWATDSLQLAKQAYAGLSYKHETVHGHPWSATYPDHYAEMRHDIQYAQLAKAGAHLAQLLQSIWP